MRDNLEGLSQLKNGTDFYGSMHSTEEEIKWAFDDN